MEGKPLRILHIIDSLDPRQGGTVECVRQVGGAASRSGHTVEVLVCADPPRSKWLAGFPLKSHPVGPGIGKYAYTPRLRGWLRRHGREFDAWIIHGLWQYQGLGASRLASAMGIPYFVYAHGMLDPWNRRAAPFRYLKKLAYWIAAERRTVERAAALVFTSREESTLARRYFPGARWREAIVGNGIAEPPVPEPGSDARFREAHDIAPGRQVLLFLSRVHPKKGLDILLQAFAALPAARERCILVIAGDGDAAYVQSLKALAARLGIDGAVRWTGPLYDERKWQAFCAADLFVLPSHQENFGIAVVESLAMGTPVCTTAGVNIHEQLERDRAGIVCRDTEDGVAAALAQWLALAEEEKALLGSNARRCFEDRFRVDAASERLLLAIRQAVAENPGSRWKAEGASATEGP